MVRNIYLLFFVTSLSITRVDSYTANLIFLPNNTLNYCNDGTIAGYYWRPAISGSNLDHRFVIFLQGGGWCWNARSCAIRFSRTPGAMTSKLWPPTKTQGGGIFSSADWSNANIVYIPYCSSDGWIGNRTASNETAHWHFNGKNIVKSVMDDLLKNNGPLESATEILFTGCSAGGRGVFNLLDYVNDYLKGKIVKQNGTEVKIKGFFDSAWWLEDFRPWPNIWPTPLSTQAKNLYSLANAQPDEDCHQIFGEDSKWQCAFGPSMWQFIKTDHSYSLFLTDQFQLQLITDNIIPLRNPPPEQVPYIEEFLNTTRYTLQPLIQTKKNVFAASCFSHCSTESSNWFNVKINGSNLDTVIREWFFNNTKFQLIDSCSTFKCGVGCL